MEVLGQICISSKREEVHPNCHHGSVHPSLSGDPRKSTFHPCFTGVEMEADDFPEVPQEARERAGKTERTPCLFVALGTRSCFKPRPPASLRDGSAHFYLLHLLNFWCTGEH